MKKQSEYMRGREDGMKLAMDIVRKSGVKGLEEELKFRNITGINTALAKKDLDAASEKIKLMTIDTLTVLSVAVLHDEFDFGKKRAQRFVDRFNLKAECLMDKLVTWPDFIQNIEEEMGMKLSIRYNN